MIPVFSGVRFACYVLCVCGNIYCVIHLNIKLLVYQIYKIDEQGYALVCNGTERIMNIREFHFHIKVIKYDCLLFSIMRTLVYYPRISYAEENNFLTH